MKTNKELYPSQTYPMNTITEVDGNIIALSPNFNNSP